jgi:hypothetical protein
MSFSFKDVFIASEGISVIHVSEFVEKLVHNFVVQILLLIYIIGFLLDKMVEAHSEGQLELIVELVLVNLDTFLLDICS